MSEQHYIDDFGEERVMIRTGDGKFVSKPKAVVELEEENARLKKLIRGLEKVIEKLENRHLCLNCRTLRR